MSGRFLIPEQEKRGWRADPGGGPWCFPLADLRPCRPAPGQPAPSREAAPRASRSRLPEARRVFRAAPQAARGSRPRPLRSTPRHRVVTPGGVAASLVYPEQTSLLAPSQQPRSGGVPGRAMASRAAPIPGRHAATWSRPHPARATPRSHPREGHVVIAFEALGLVGLDLPSGEEELRRSCLTTSSSAFATLR